MCWICATDTPEDTHHSLNIHWISTVAWALCWRHRETNKTWSWRMSWGEKDKQMDVSIRCDMKWTFPKSIWKYVPGVQEGGVEATQLCKWKVFNSYWHDHMYIYVTVNSRKTDDIVQGEWAKGQACETSTFKRNVKEDEARSQTA